MPYSSSIRMIFSVRSSLVMAHTPFMYFFSSMYDDFSVIKVYQNDRLKVKLIPVYFLYHGGMQLWKLKS